MGAGTNVGERADGERDCHRRGRPKSSGRHEQQRFIGPCPRPGEATANVHAGADQLKRGVTPLEEAQMSQRLLRLSTLLTQRTDNGARIERYEEGKIKLRESERKGTKYRSDRHGWTRNTWIGGWRDDGWGGGMVENEHGEGDERGIHPRGWRILEDASGSPETLVQRLGNNHCDRELYNE